MTALTAEPVATADKMIGASYRKNRGQRLAEVYRAAKDAVIAQGFAWEIEWQANRRLDDIDESEFLRESAWTILSAGFRESVVRRIFPPLSQAFLEWRSAKLIHEQRQVCKLAAMRVFGNEKKITAILDIAAMVTESGYRNIWNRIEKDGVSFLQTLPYIGPVTAFHLAKNLGLPVVKPDRHLQRIAKAAGFMSPFQLCEVIADQVGDPIQVVDIVLWRYATLFSNYVATFTSLSNLCCPDGGPR